jgi:hypothetical protein
MFLHDQQVLIEDDLGANCLWEIAIATLEEESLAFDFFQFIGGDDRLIFARQLLHLQFVFQANERRIWTINTTMKARFQMYWPYFMPSRTGPGAVPVIAKAS